jgi:hypothetical protein
MTDLFPPSKRPIGDEPSGQPEIGDPPDLDDIPGEEDEESEEEALARAKSLFSRFTVPVWADYVEAEREATQEKTARLRAERLAKVAT